MQSSPTAAQTAARFAVVLALTQQQQPCQLHSAVQSLRAVGWRDDVVCLHGDGLAGDEMGCTRLLAVPTIRLDAGPGGAEAWGYARARSRVPPPARTIPHTRASGEPAAPALMLHAWRLLEYSLVLCVDLDIALTQSPQPSFEAAMREGLIFLANEENATRGYGGLSSRLMLLRPNAAVAAIIEANSAEGHFIPYTLTEQDVLESMLPPRVPPLPQDGSRAADTATQLPTHVLLPSNASDAASQQHCTRGRRWQRGASAPLDATSAMQGSWGQHNGKQHLRRTHGRSEQATALASGTTTAAAARRFAMVLVLANGTDWRGSGPSLQLCRLWGVLGSLRAVGWRGDVVCMHAGLTEEALAYMTACGCTRLHAVPTLRLDAGPGGRAATSWARERNRVPPPPTSTVLAVQMRKDGAQTALKFHAWRLVEYELVMCTDLDVVFLQSPLPTFERAARDGLEFLADEETWVRGYRGLNTHLMLIRPNTAVAAIIEANSAEGHFIPYTLTEQDVLESMLPPRVPPLPPMRLPSGLGLVGGGDGAVDDAARLPVHVHHGQLGLFFAFRRNNVSFRGGPAEARCAALLHKGNARCCDSTQRSKWACCGGTPCEATKGRVLGGRCDHPPDYVHGEYQCRHMAYHYGKGYLAPCRWYNGTCQTWKETGASEPNWGSIGWSVGTLPSQAGYCPL